GTAAQLDQAQAPRQSLAEEKIVAMVQDRACQQLAFARLPLPVELDRKAALAGFSRRILDRAAFPALLQLESAQRRGGREPKRDAAARRRRQRRKPRAKYRIFLLRPGDLFTHEEERTAAPLPRP